MNDLLNLSPLVTQAIRPDGRAPSSNLPQGAALDVLSTTARLWQAQTGSAGNPSRPRGVAQQEGVIHAG